MGVQKMAWQSCTDANSSCLGIGNVFAIVTSNPLDFKNSILSSGMFIATYSLNLAILRKRKTLGNQLKKLVTNKFSTFLNSLDFKATKKNKKLRKKKNHMTLFSVVPSVYKKMFS